MIRAFAAATVFLALAPAAWAQLGPDGPVPAPPPAGSNAAPQPGVLAREETVKKQDALGDSYTKHQTTYATPNGVTQDTKTHQVSVPPPPPVTTSTATSVTTTTTPPQ